MAGKYRLERELGQGGMGTVFVAVHVSTLRPFAIKLLRPELAGDAEAEARFFREATLASSIHHPAIVDVYDVGRHGDTPYMVMKLLSGQTLRQRIKQGSLSPETALELIIPVVEGVAAAHAAGVVHRDLKPDNIMLHEHSGVLSPKILDFGISKLLGSEQREKLTKTGISLGTPLYMAPEQMRGERELDAGVDVYSLGVILYQMLTGALPYYGKTYADLVISVMSGGAKPVRALNPAVAPRLEAIVMRAIANQRAERHASVAELLAELQEVRGAAETTDAARVLDLPMRDTSTPFTVEARQAWSPPRDSRRTRWIVAGGALLLAAGVVAALWPSGGPAAEEPHVVTAAAPPPEPPRAPQDLPGAAEPEPPTPPAPAAATAQPPTAFAAAPPQGEAAAAEPAATTAAEKAVPEPTRVEVAPKPVAADARTRSTDETQQHERRASGRSPKPPSQERTAPTRRASSELLDPFQ